MKTPAEIIAEAPPRWGGSRLADLLRQGIHRAPLSPEEKHRREAERIVREKAEREEHAQRQHALWIEHVAKCGAPPRVVEAMQHLRDTAAVNAARACLDSHKQNLVLSGWTGTGKTVAACLLFGAARSRETRTGLDLLEWDAEQGLFVDFRRLLRVTDTLRFNRADTLPPAERRLFEDACRVRVLVLDEVGGEPGEGLEKRHKQLLEELADRRDAPGRLTAYTTNLSLQRDGEKPSDFGAFVGPRVVSRIGRSCVLRDCGTRDLRSTGAP